MLAAVYGLNLTKLNILSCGSVTQPGLMRILISNPNLRTLNLACCRRVFSGLPDGTVTIFNEMKVNEINLSQLSIPNFRSIGTLKGLKSLEINELDSPGSEILKGLEGLETTSLLILKARCLGVPVQERKKKHNLKEVQILCNFFYRKQLFVDLTFLNLPVMYMFLIEDWFSSSKTFVIFFSRFRI